MAAERARTRVAAMLLVAAAVVLALLSPLLSAGLAHRSPASTGVSATTRTTVATAARGSLGHAPERVAGAAVLARHIAQPAQTGSAPGGLHLTAALAGVGLLFAFAGRRLPSPARARTPSGTDRATQRNRGPPRAAARLA